MSDDDVACVVEEEGGEGRGGRACVCVLAEGKGRGDRGRKKA